MSFDRSRVERQHDGIFARFGRCLKDWAPSFALGPAIEAIVGRRVRTVLARTITPCRPRLQQVNNTADDAPIVVPIRPRRSRRQMRLDTTPLPVIQPKQTCEHSLAPESRTRTQEKHAALEVSPTHDTTRLEKQTTYQRCQCTASRRLRPCDAITSRRA